MLDGAFHVQVIDVVVRPVGLLGIDGGIVAIAIVHVPPLPSIGLIATIPDIITGEVEKSFEVEI